jgi:hypothetical protein
MNDGDLILSLLPDGKWCDREPIVEAALGGIKPERAMKLRNVWIVEADPLEMKIRKARRRAILNRMIWLRCDGALAIRRVDGITEIKKLTGCIHDARCKAN